MAEFWSDRDLSISSAGRVLAMLVVDRSAPGGDLWRILDAAGAGRSVAPQQYAMEVTAFVAHVILAAFSVYAKLHGSFVSFRAHEFIANGIKDAELSWEFMDRAGLYNIAGGITAATPEEKWTTRALVETFWDKVSPEQELTPATAHDMEDWVRVQLALGKKQFGKIIISPDPPR
jgi:hypothetical protein